MGPFFSQTPKFLPPYYYSSTDSCGIVESRNITEAIHRKTVYFMNGERTTRLHQALAKIPWHSPFFHYLNLLGLRSSLHNSERAYDWWSWNGEIIFQCACVNCQWKHAYRSFGIFSIINLVVSALSSHCIPLEITISSRSDLLVSVSGRCMLAIFVQSIINEYQLIFLLSLKLKTNRFCTLSTVGTCIQWWKSNSITSLDWCSHDR